MSDANDSRPTPLGIYDRTQRPQVTGIEVAAAILSVIWLGLAVIVGMNITGDGDTTLSTIRFLVTVLAIFLPVAMIWVAAMAMRTARVMREESARLQTAVDALRHAYVAQSQGRSSGTDSSITKKLDEIAAAQRRAESTMAMFTTSREARTAPQPSEPEGSQADDQASLALGTPAEALTPPLPHSDFIRALNFPETAEDEQGFAALRRALRDRQTKQLVQAAQDVLTLLSQDGIYMDDLRPDLARPEIWRRFAAGERGRTVAALGGIRDRSSLALSNGRMKQDPIFRDAAHHFLRLFDRGFVQFEKTATDEEIQRFAETRTARAFMLLGRVTGTFD